MHKLPSRAATALMLDLAPDELERKLRARADVYQCLNEQMGAVLDTVPRNRLAREEIMPALPHVPAPDDERVLRYDWRARALLALGSVREAITWVDHYAPVTAELVPSDA